LPETGSIVRILFRLHGQVECGPLLAGPDGQYSDAYRAAIVTDRRGRYRLTTSVPPPYARRPPHIHILVDMRGYAGLITQHYPRAGQSRATFDLTMETE